MLFEILKHVVHPVIIIGWKLTAFFNLFLPLFNLIYDGSSSLMKLTVLDKALGLPLDFEFNYALSGYFQVGQINFEDISSVFAIVERLYVHNLRL